MKLLWNVICILILLPGSFAFSQSIVINEFMASNSESHLASDGQSYDWIELYNPTDEPVSVAGMFLSDDASFLTKWQFPTDQPDLTTIPKQGYRLVWASALDNSNPNELHANFSLSADGECIYLTAVNGFAVIDHIQFCEQASDQSFGRSPNGSDQWLFQNEPTPNAENSDGYIEQVVPVQFNVERGFYDQPFTLTLTCDDPNATIWYTIYYGIVPHSTNPGGRGGDNSYYGTIYTGPISITQTTCVRATAVKNLWKDAPVITHSYIYLDDVMTQPSRPQGFPSDWASNVVDYKMDPRVVFDPAYEPTFKEDILSIPSVSIVIPSADFFGDKGIYSHAESRGDSWEREACIEWIDPNTGNTFGVNAGLRTHGGVGRSLDVAKHSLRIAFRNKYGTPFLNFPLFPDLDISTFDSLVLRACWNYSWTGDSGMSGPTNAQYMRDAFARDTVRDMGGLTPHGRHVNVYINGLYWGIYILVERPDDGFASKHLGGSKSDYDVLKATNSFSTAGMEIVAGDRDSWLELFDLIEYSNPADDAVYDEIAKRVDIPALIDYMLMVVFVGSRDAPTLLNSDDLPRNFYTIRNRSIDGGFIFIPWDVEWSLEYESENRVAVLGGQQNPGLIFARLRANKRFNQLVADKIQKYFFNRGVLSPESAQERYWNRSEDLAKAIVGESARWGDAKRSSQPYTRDDDWARERNRIINSYLSQRTDIVFSQLRSYGYYSALSAPVFKINGESAAQKDTVSLGDSITITSGSGIVYYTLDGTDPMSSMTSSDIVPVPSLTAQVYSNTLTVQGRIRLKARTYSNQKWSALNEAVFTVH